MKRWAHAGRVGLGIGLAIVFLLPVYWMLVAALRQPGLPPPRTVEWWPVAVHWENYARLFQMVPMARYIGNSVLVVAAAVPITWFSAAIAGFAMAQQPERLRRLLLILCVALLMLPGPSVWIFRYQILRWLGLIDSLWALILPAFAASSPLFVLLFYWAFRRIPGEVFEAGQLDGAGVWTAWWRLGRPVVRPTSVGVVVLTFASYWSDFISPILYIYRPKLYTLAIGLQIVKQLDATNWPLLMAAAVVMTAPIVLLFVAMQRFFLDELSLANLIEGN